MTASDTRQTPNAASSAGPSPRSTGIALRAAVPSTRIAAAALAASAALAAAPHASADPAGDKVLAAMDAAVNRAKTHKFQYDVVTQEPGKPERKLQMSVLMKGEKRLTEFHAPADMKGTKVLVLTPSQMYVYLPAFGKVRRIASHTTDQSLLGLTFSQDDFATQTLGGMYTAQIASETPTEYKLVATPKPGQTTPYAKIELTLPKDRMLPTELRYFNAAGKHIKTETRTGYSCEGDICTPGELKMVDHTRGGMWTRIVRKSWKVNEAIPDDVFSKRSLGE